MPFNSETARLAGKKSKRKKEFGNDEFRLELLEFGKDLMEDLKKRNLSTEQKLRLLPVVLSYSMPKLKMTEIQDVTTNEGFKPVTINFTHADN